MASPPRLLLCEGAEDVVFFERLITVRKLPRFRIKDTGGKKSKAAGNTRFWFALEALKTEIGIRNILIVADNDDDPAISFRRVRQQIKRVYGDDRVPNRPLEKKGSNPSITILMIPWVGECGSLEGLCLEAARNCNKNVAGHVDTFAALVGAENWEKIVRRHKMWLRAYLAACCQRDPFVFLGSVFRETRREALIPLEHPSFNRVADVLKEFP